MSWRDITYPLSTNSTHWPGQPPMSLEPVSELCCGDTANVSCLQTSVHTGTHMDAPLHFIPDGIDITHFPLDLAEGTLRVALIDDSAEHITAAHISDYEARKGDLKVGDRLLFKTRNSKEDWHKEPFKENYCAIAPDAAQLLVQRQVSLVGVDYLSVAPFDDPSTTHRILLSAQLWVVEGLDLREVQERSYQYLCLPLAIHGSDASPVRFLLSN